MKKFFLDARELEHPKPLEQAIVALRELDEENYFYMLHRKKPIPLIELARKQYFQVFSHEDESGAWHILISKNTTINLSSLIETF